MQDHDFGSANQQKDAKHMPPSACSPQALKLALSAGLSACAIRRPGKVSVT
jgi:hypothetical protein